MDKDIQSATVTVIVPDNSAFLKVLREAVGSAASLMGFDGATVLQLQMAVDEACTNVIEHGTPSKSPGKLRLTLETLPDKLIIHIQDSCIRYSVTKQAPPTLEQYFNSNKTKGLGLLIIHEFVDEIQHSYLTDLGNKLSLTKYLPRK